MELNGMENQIQCDTPIQKEKLRHLISLKLNGLPFFLLPTEWFEKKKNNKRL